FFRFGIPLLMKRTDRLVSTEADALRFLNGACSSLPVPRVLDSFVYHDVTYTIMTTLPGKTLMELTEAEDMPEDEMSVIVDDVKTFLGTLWSIPQPIQDHGKVMCSASGHGLPDPTSLHERVKGPFDSQVNLYSYMSGKALESYLSKTPQTVLNALARDRIVWVHTDLRMQNLLVRNGRLSGIVDWENSGWLPSNWQLHIFRWPQPGCQGSWVRTWMETRLDEQSETAYAASMSVL
ncbi:hypothetical protein FISHEDRAFT_23802, partial [Fistulina hepatica ATCC 64428]